MRLMWRLLRGDKRNRCRLPNNNFVAVFDAVTHRANANSRTNRGYRPRPRLLTRLREEQGTWTNHATTEIRVMQKNNRFRALNDCVPAQPSRLCGNGKNRRLDSSQTRSGRPSKTVEAARRQTGRRLPSSRKRTASLNSQLEKTNAQRNELQTKFHQER
jgi:hypothetical protein